MTTQSTAVASPRPGSPSAATDLARLALDLTGWNRDLATTLGVEPEAAIQVLESRMRPLREVEPRGMVDGERGPQTDRLMAALRLIGAKIAPTLSDEQANAWLAAMVIALSDLPGRFAIRGAEEAIHRPCKFLNEVEGHVRELAEDAEHRHKLALARLRLMKRELEKIDQPRLPAPPPPELTTDDLRGMARNDLGRAMLRLGLANGHITQEQFDQAMEREQPAQGDDE